MTGSRLTVVQRVAEAQSDWVKAQSDWAETQNDWVKAHSGSKSGRGSE